MSGSPACAFITVQQKLCFCFGLRRVKAISIMNFTCTFADSGYNSTPDHQQSLRMEITLLKQASLFKNLDEEQLRTIAQHMAVKNCLKNAMLFHEGEQPDALYIVLTGRVKIYVSDEEGKELVLGTLGPGDYFGEMALLDGSPRSATVSTTENTTLVRMDKNQFDTCVNRIPQIAINMLKIFATRIRNLNDHVKDLALLDVYGRVARTILRLASTQDNELKTGPITQQEIANMVGASREMVSRVLNSLKTDGYITVAEKRITICDPPPLSH